MKRLRIRTGVAFTEGAWHVVQNFDGDLRVYDPPFATEREAEAKASELAAAFKTQAAASGLTVRPHGAAS